MRWIAWLVLAACSGSAGGAAHPAAPPAARPPPPAPTEAAPSEPECDQLITHAVALGIDEQSESRGVGTPTAPPAGRGVSPRGIDERATEQAAAGPRSTESDHEAIRRALHDELLAGCRDLPRDAYRCAMAATTLTALAACQRTPSSSTSNSSVAPGGMSPRPAPRSP